MKSQTRRTPLRLFLATIILTLFLISWLIPSGFIFAEDPPFGGGCWIIGYGPNTGEEVTLIVGAWNTAGKYIFATVTDSNGNPIETDPNHYYIEGDFFIGNDFRLGNLNNDVYNAELKLFNSVDTSGNPVGDPVFTSAPFSFRIWDHIQDLEVGEAKDPNNVKFQFYVTNSNSYPWQLQLYKSNYASSGGEPNYWRDYWGTIDSETWELEVDLPSGEYCTMLDIYVLDDYTYDPPKLYETYHNMISFVVTPKNKIYQFSQPEGGYFPSNEIMWFKDYVESTVTPVVFSGLTPYLNSAISACYIGDLKEAKKELKDFQKEVKKSSLLQEVEEDLVTKAQLVIDYIKSGEKLK